MTNELCHPLTLQYVPDIAVEIIVPCKENSARFTKPNAGYAADNMFVAIAAHFLISSYVEHAACSVVRPCSEVEAGGHKGDSVDVELVTLECLVAHSVPDIPKLGSCVTRT